MQSDHESKETYSGISVDINLKGPIKVVTFWQEVVALSHPLPMFNTSEKCIKTCEQMFAQAPL